MENLLFILRILLVAIFGVAGFAKLFDLSGSKKAVEGFGVPESLAKPLSVLLPIVEIAIAISLIFVQTSWFGAIGGAEVFVDSIINDAEEHFGLRRSGEHVISWEAATHIQFYHLNFGLLGDAGCGFNVAHIDLRLLAL